MTDEDPIGELLADFPVTVQIPVAWGDMDAMGHVNNAVYFRYFETARIKCLAELGLGSIEQSDGVGPILHSASCRFRIPLTHPDTVTVGAQIGEVGHDRFVMRYRAVSHHHGAVAADGESLIVTFDYSTGGKARVSDALAARLVDLRRA
ncbi:acyl-CoA thioesterase [Nocardioides sp. Kera G14]|uniref:acyl-CoA thioesterase n=1 Tax=Nocardioides sp. Kera G14 TaxID=2884264 RepID=UPI001D1002A6|nr:thioesterase family protein [Nocardioides sp. Kera G14]UDY24638.1 acyl-CoA thioesterase [Nocardioides sp. Kera G14]